MHAMLPKLIKTDFPVLNRKKLETLQVNLGYLCNQSCLHCHVNAGPKRKEIMQRETIDQIIHFIDVNNIKRLDLTGGAPELNPHFSYLVSEAKKRSCHIIDRCNLTVLQESGQEKTAEFLANNKIEIVASLPCYLEENVNSQRGDGVFSTSIQSIQQLNKLGYGIEGSGLELNLMYNPVGPHLPPPQQQLEMDYKSELGENYGISFNHLYTLTNMPIQRFGSTLISKGEFDNYMTLLKESFKRDNLAGVMCRTLISIDWQGYVYDCDFNQMLAIPLVNEASSNSPKKTHISSLLGQDLENWTIQIADHCYGCSAGQGSSCGGALV